jgi:YgiT-type zinc finger domain-containing protein
MVCDICGTDGARVRRMGRTYGKGDALLVIENVPIISCPHCGESYLTADTARQLDRIRRHRRELAVNRAIPVAEYARE